MIERKVQIYARSKVSRNVRLQSVVLDFHIYPARPIDSEFIDP